MASPAVRFAILANCLEPDNASGRMGHCALGAPYNAANPGAGMSIKSDKWIRRMAEQTA